MNFELLETERLFLRKLTPADFNYLFENLPQEEIMRFLGHRSTEEFEKEKAKYEGGYSTHNRSFCYFQLLDKASEKVIGGCGFHNWFPEHKRSEFGYRMLDETFRSKGLMSEAADAILRYGFENVELHRIEALVGKSNQPSLRIMEKFGFQYEGLLREHFFINGVFEDSLMFSLLVND